MGRLQRELTDANRACLFTWFKSYWILIVQIQSIAIIFAARTLDSFLTVKPYCGILLHTPLCVCRHVFSKIKVWLLFLFPSPSAASASKSETGGKPNYIFQVWFHRLCCIHNPLVSLPKGKLERADIGIKSVRRSSARPRHCRISGKQLKCVYETWTY